MRLLVFFDLPTITAQDKREYRAFRKLLIKNGFFMRQESVYCRMILNKGQEEAIVYKKKKNKPKKKNHTKSHKKTNKTQKKKRNNLKTKKTYRTKKT